MDCEWELFPPSPSGFGKIAGFSAALTSNCACRVTVWVGGKKMKGRNLNVSDTASSQHQRIPARSRGGCRYVSVVQRRRLKEETQQPENNSHTSNVGRVNTSVLHSAEKWRISRRQTSFMPPPHPLPDKFRDKSSICSFCSLRLSGTSGIAANQSFHGDGGGEEEEPSSALLNPSGLSV